MPINLLFVHCNIVTVIDSIIERFEPRGDTQYNTKELELLGEYRRECYRSASGLNVLDGIDEYATILAALHKDRFVCLPGLKGADGRIRCGEKFMVLEEPSDVDVLAQRAAKIAVVKRKFTQQHSIAELERKIAASKAPMPVADAQEDPLEAKLAALRQQFSNLQSVGPSEEEYVGVLMSTVVFRKHSGYKQSQTMWEVFKKHRGLAEAYAVESQTMWVVFI
jgi:hypothetical protein